MFHSKHWLHSAVSRCWWPSTVTGIRRLYTGGFLVLRRALDRAGIECLLRSSIFPTPPFDPSAFPVSLPCCFHPALFQFLLSARCNFIYRSATPPRWLKWTAFNCTNHHSATRFFFSWFSITSSLCNLLLVDWGHVLFQVTCPYLLIEILTLKISNEIRLSRLLVRLRRMLDTLAVDLKCYWIGSYRIYKSWVVFEKYICLCMAICCCDGRMRADG